MAEAPTDHCAAARLVLTVTSLSEREGQFLGGLCYRSAPLSDKQANWLRILLERHGFDRLTEEGAND